MRPARPVLYLVVAAVAVHAVVLLVTHVQSGGIAACAFRSLDATEYYRIAQNVVAHGTFSQGQAPPLTPDTWRTPGYPAFLAAAMLVVGDSPSGLVLVQQALSVFNVALVFWLARPWMSDRRAALAALLFLVEPYHLYYSLWLLATTVFTTTLLLAWWAWHRALEARRVTWLALPAMLVGGLVLVRPVASLVPLALLPGLFIWALRRRTGQTPDRGQAEVPSAGRRASDHQAPAGRRRLWLGLAVWVACCGAAPTLWMTRNLALAERFSLSDQGGVVLAYFKAAEVELWRQGRARERYLETTLDPARADARHTVFEGIDAHLRDRFTHLDDEIRSTLRWPNLAQGNRTSVDSFEVSDALADIGWSYLTEAPFGTAVCCLLRCGSILTFPLSLALDPPEGLTVHRGRSAVLGCLYLALVVCVAVRLVRGGLGFASAYFPLAVTLALLAATTPQVDPRFRVPMIPLLIVLALLPVQRNASAAKTGQHTPTDHGDAIAP